MNNEDLYNSPKVANRIKSIAKSKNIALKELLSKCELGSNTFSHMLHGKSIAFGSLAKIADYLDCSVDYILERKTEQAETEKEKNILNMLRTLTEDGQNTVIKYIEFVCNDIRYQKYTDIAKEA